MRAAAVSREVLDQLYAVEHLGRHLLHAPLHGVSCLVNRSMIEAVQDLQQGVGDQATSALVAAELASAGIDPEQPETPPRSAVAGHAPTTRMPDASAPGGGACELALFLTERCNLRCIYCYARGGEGGRTMDPELADAALELVLDDAVTAGAPGTPVATVHLHGGGEITQEWDLLRRIMDHGRELASRRGVAIRFTAGLNGVMPSDRAAVLARELDETTISLDGPPLVQDRQRPRADGRGSSEAVLHTLEIFDRERARYGLRVTVLGPGVADLPTTVEHLVRVSATRAIQVEPVFPLGRGVLGSHRSANGAGWLVDPDRFVTAFREAREVAAAWGRDLRYSGARYPLVTDVFCKAVLGALCVTPAGQVTSCFEAGGAADDRLGFGAWDRASGRLEIDTQRRRGLLRLSTHHSPRSSACWRCVARWHCAGDCPMKRGAEGGGGIEAAAGRCRISRQLTADQILRALEAEP